MLVKTISLDSRSAAEYSVSSSAAPACAMASMMSTPGMMGKSGKVAGEVRLVDGDVLQRDDALLALDLDQAVDQQEGIAVGKQGHDLVDVHGLGVCGLVRTVTHLTLEYKCAGRVGAEAKDKYRDSGFARMTIHKAALRMTMLFASLLLEQDGGIEEGWS